MTLNKDLLREYAYLKIEERDVKRRVEKLKGEVLSELQASNLQEATVGDIGILVVVPTRAYKYSQAIAILEEQLEKAKAAERAKGDATYTDGSFVKFNPLQGKEE